MQFLKLQATYIVICNNCHTLIDETLKKYVQEVKPGWDVEKFQRYFGELHVIVEEYGPNKKVFVYSE